MSKEKYNVGDKVCLLNDQLHVEQPDKFPPAGTIGIIDSAFENGVFVRWITWEDPIRRNWPLYCRTQHIGRAKVEGDIKIGFSIKEE